MPSRQMVRLHLWAQGDFAQLNIQLIMTNYKAIVTLQGGGHKIVRGAQDMVAHLSYMVSQAKKSIFKSEESVYGIAVALIASVKFINEYTGEVYLTI